MPPQCYLKSLLQTLRLLQLGSSVLTWGQDPFRPQTALLTLPASVSLQRNGEPISLQVGPELPGEMFDSVGSFRVSW